MSSPGEKVETCEKEDMDTEKKGSSSEDEEEEEEYEVEKIMEMKKSDVRLFSANVLVRSYSTRTRVSKHTGGNCSVTGNFLSLQTTICSSTPCINSRGQCTYLHQSKDLMLIVYESLNQKLKLNPGCS